MRCRVHCGKISYCEVCVKDEILRHFVAEIEMEFRAPDLNKHTSGSGQVGTLLRLLPSWC